MPFAAAVLALVMMVAAQADPRTALLERAGWEAIASGQLDIAAESFRQGVATVAFIQRRDDDARAALVKALGIDPKLARAESLMGQLLYRTGDVTGAIRVYETLASERPGDQDVLATLDRWRRELDLQRRM